MNLPPNLLSAFVTVFVTIGPIETAVVFAALTAGVHRPDRKSLASRSVTIAGVVLLLFALGGGAVLSLLRVSLPAFRVAGGVLLFLQALTLTFSNPGLSSINASETRDAQGAGDIAIFPLAFPVIAGPGSLAAVVLVMGRTEVWLERAAIVLMVAICLAVTYVAMLVSERLVRRLGKTGSDVVGRISGAACRTGRAVHLRRSATGGAVCAGLRSARGRADLHMPARNPHGGSATSGVSVVEAALAWRP